MLIDEALIKIKSGKGGDGAVTFHREKFIDKGGPDGGDGGRGGDVIFKSSESADTLRNYATQRFYKADDGDNGRKNNMYGRAGKSITLTIPVGTIIYDDDGNIIHDFKKNNEEIVVARGGKGGLGNTHFKSSTNQVPHESTPGEEGKEMSLKLVLKLIADVGIVGLPNAGKSTLISSISNAKPKVADYPFTTLEPVLGVVFMKDRSFTLCDVPGLIEGASSGKGLGHKFLKHLERTKILVHLIDKSSEDPAKDYKTIREELKKFSPTLAEKKEIIVLSKADLNPKKIDKFKFDLEISAATHLGLDKLKTKIIQLLDNDR